MIFVVEAVAIDETPNCCRRQERRMYGRLRTSTWLWSWSTGYAKLARTHALFVLHEVPQSEPAEAAP
jgi:hypothetical protein